MNNSAEKRSRFVFTENQIKHLKAHYHETSKYVTRKEKLKLSETLNIPEKQIVLWFQNRRQNENENKKFVKSISRENKNVDEVEASNLDFSTDIAVEISENGKENIPPEILIKEESLDTVSLRARSPFHVKVYIANMSE